MRALCLLERYVDLQEAQHAMPPPTPGDPAQLRRTLEAQDASAQCEPARALRRAQQVLRL